MADTDANVDDWLRKIVHSAHHMNYSGTFVYQAGSYLETSRITHIVDGENEHERLEGLGGERSEVIRKNGQVWCYLGGNKKVVAQIEDTRTFPSLLPEHLSLLNQNYDINFGDEDRVAGFSARSILFQPRDNMRYAHKMWIDSDTGLLLKAVVLDAHKHVIEQYMFTELKIGGDVDRKWIVPSGSKKIMQPGEGSTQSPPEKSVITESGWRVYFLPAGFKKIAEISRHLRGETLSVTHIVYSDGLAGVSLFVEQSNEKSTIKPGLHDMGLSQIYTKSMDGYLLTVVGELPPRTLLQIAESVRYGGLRQ
jgi:sigma-E factor negative regulatory protein RseB